MPKVKHDTVMVLDFGGQYTHLIAKRLRQLKVYSEILSPKSSPDALKGAKGIILSGGPHSVYSSDQPPYSSDLFDLGLPILGLCYGHQILAKHFGGGVARGDTQEYGSASLEIVRPSGIFQSLNATETVWMSHGDSVKSLPPGFEIIGSTDDCPIAAMGAPELKIYGLQFHPEVSHTASGMKILDQFLDICGASRTWDMETFVTDACDRIKRDVGDRKVFLFVSGGVDSTVAFFLLNKALGKSKVIGLHIDNGFMRKNETKLAVDSLRVAGFDNLHVVDASDVFIDAISGVAEPQKKRQIIGDAFMGVQQQAAEPLGLDPEEFVVGLGTLYPDIIESGGTDHAAVIKTHHNRVDIIQKLISEGKVIEPLDQLYKDEVRQVGRQLELPDALIDRHPFPGPGLAVRCLCSDGPSADHREAVESSVSAEVATIAGRFGYESDVLPIKSVGVQGDVRTYAHPAVLTGPADWGKLERLSTAITNAVDQVNRVLYLITPEKLPVLSAVKAYVTKERLERLREADAVAMHHLDEVGWMDRIFQMPTILVPLSANGKDECVILRPLESEDVMTARFAVVPDIEGLARKIVALGGVASVMYDITHKPPGTIEWE